MICRYVNSIIMVFFVLSISFENASFLSKNVFLSALAPFENCYLKFVKLAYKHIFYSSDS